MLQFNNGNWEHRAIWGEDVIPWGTANSASRHAVGTLPEVGKWVRLEVAAGEVGLKAGRDHQRLGLHAARWHGVLGSRGDRHEDLAIGAGVSIAPGLGSGPERREEMQTSRGRRSGPQSRSRTNAAHEQQQTIQTYFIENVHVASQPLFAPLRKEIAEIEAELDSLRKSMASTMIMAEQPNPRETYVLTRGQYDQPDKSQKVEPGVPSVLPALPKDAPPNRLALARWLVDPQHPLTARVTVNRYWQRFFGTGIVKTAEDFGSQGEWPSHPGAVGLAGDGVHRQRLEHQAYPKADRDVAHLPAKLAGLAETRGPRSGESALGERPALSLGCRGDPRQCPRRQRFARRASRRQERQTLPAAGALESRRLHQQQHGELQEGRGQLRFTAGAFTRSGNGPRRRLR